MQQPKGVVLYGPGRIGQLAARLIAERGWPIKAVVNRSGAKIGKDLGDLSGLPILSGLVVQDENEFDPASVEADIAVVTSSDRVALNFPVYKRFLEAGLNVLSVGCEASYPWAGTPELADELDRIAKANGVTFTGSGFQDVLRVWIGKLLIGACASVRGFSHMSYTDIAPHGLETTRLVGAGLTLDEFNKAQSGAGERETSIYRVFFEQVARSVNLDVESVEEVIEPIVKSVPLHCPALDREIPAGDVIGTRFKTVIRAKGGVVATAENELRLFEPGEAPRIVWTVDGSPPAHVVVTDFDSYVGTSSPLVNRIPDVLAAPPGLVTIDQLGPPKFWGNAG